MDEDRQKILFQALEKVGIDPDAKKMEKNLADYLDLIQEFLTFAGELPEPRQTEQIKIIDRMIDLYKEFASDTEKIIKKDPSKWQKIRLK